MWRIIFIDFLYWIKNKKSTVSHINKKDNKCNSRVKKKIKPLINKYNWEGITFTSEKDDWKKFQKNNLTIALNILYAKKEKIYPAYVSKK